MKPNTFIQGVANEELMKSAHNNSVDFGKEPHGENKKVDEENIGVFNIKKLNPDEDSEMTLADYATDDYLDEDEIEEQKDIAKEMGADLEDIHIYTSDSVRDIRNFDNLFSYVLENMENSKEIGGYKVGTVRGKKLACHYAEGGLEVIYALN